MLDINQELVNVRYNSIWDRKGVMEMIKKEFSTSIWAKKLGDKKLGFLSFGGVCYITGGMSA